MKPIVFFLPLFAIALCVQSCATHSSELTLAHDVNVPKEFRAGNFSVEHPGFIEGNSTVERYVNAYERGWALAVERFANNIDFDDPSPFVMSGWAEESNGGDAGFSDGCTRVRFLIDSFGKQKVSGCLQQFRSELLEENATNFENQIPASDIDSGNYKVDTYIQLATELQSLDHTNALARLHAMTKDFHHGQRVIILCRMLFAQRPGSDFRRPMLGGPSLLGGTDYADWPLEPIELVDGVPFLITRGYFLAGKAEPDEWYVRYCETNCNWSDFRYVPKSGQQKQDALNKLFASPKWKKPLDVYEREFLAKQIAEFDDARYERMRRVIDSSPNKLLGTSLTNAEKLLSLENVKWDEGYTSVPFGQLRVYHFRGFYLLLSLETRSQNVKVANFDPSLHIDGITDPKERMSNYWEQVHAGFEKRTEEMNAARAQQKWIKFAFSASNHLEDLTLLQKKLQARNILCTEMAASPNPPVSFRVESNDFNRARIAAIQIISDNALTVDIETDPNGWGYEIFENGKKLNTVNF